MLDLLVAAVSDYAILMLDPAGNITSWNGGAQRIKGYRSDEIIGKHFSIFYSAEDVVAGKPQHELEIARKDGSLEDEGWRIRKNGTRFWANVVITALRDPDGNLRGFGKITRDLTERRTAELALRASEERFRLMVDVVQDYAILMLDAAGKIATWNVGAERSTGFRPEEVIGHPFSIFYPAGESGDGQAERDLHIALTEGYFENEGWRARKDGSAFWARISITALYDNNGTLQGYSAITRDLTERVRYESLLEHMADHDPLTGAMNRRSFGREMASHIARASRYGSTGALLMIDLDNFKLLNDTRGHSAGDELLVRLVRALKLRLRQSDILARLGGDEFAVLLPVADEPTAAYIAGALLKVVTNESDSLRSVSITVSASIGLALFTDGDNMTADEWLARADDAMYDAKNGGGNRWVHYSPKRSGIVG